MPTETPDSLDPRLHPYDGQYAADYLRLIPKAQTLLTQHEYLKPTQGIVTSPLATMYRGASQDSGIGNQILYGAKVHIYRDAGDYLWVQSLDDGYVGYVERQNIAAAPSRDAALSDSFYVTALHTHLYPEAGFKRPALMWLPMGARITLKSPQNYHEGIHNAAPRYLETTHGGYVYSSHIAPVQATSVDIVDTAEKFLHTPYLWGGVSSRGIDCSALVQIALRMKGIVAPRDSDMQAAHTGRLITENIDDILQGRVPAQRGDLVFFTGHVGIMTDDIRMIHANSWHMKVSHDPMAAYTEKMKKLYPTQENRFICLRRIEVDVC